MEIRACGGGKGKAPRERGETIEIVTTHATDAHFHAFAPCLAKLAQECAQGASGNFVAMRVGEYGDSSCRAQHRHRSGKRGPGGRHMPRTVASEPELEGFGDITRVALGDELACQMLTRRDFVLQTALGELATGEFAAPFETRADLAQALATPAEQLMQLCGERRIVWIDAEPEHVQLLTPPKTGELDARDEAQLARGTRRLGGGTACDGVVVGEGELLHAAARHMRN